MGDRRHRRATYGKPTPSKGGNGVDSAYGSMEDLSTLGGIPPHRSASLYHKDEGNSRQRLRAISFSPVATAHAEPRLQTAVASKPLRRRHTEPCRQQPPIGTPSAPSTAPSSRHRVTHLLSISCSYPPFACAHLALCAFVGIVSIFPGLSSIFLPTAPIYLLNPATRTWRECLSAILSPLVPLTFYPPLAKVGRVATESILLALVEDSAAAGSLSTLAKALIALALWTTTIFVRLCLGFVFGRAVGWQYPSLFSNAAIHEASHGLRPLLWAIIPLQSLLTLRLAPSRYALAFGSASTPSVLTHPPERVDAPSFPIWSGLGRRSCGTPTQPISTTAKAPKPGNGARSTRPRGLLWFRLRVSKISLHLGCLVFMAFADCAFWWPLAGLTSGWLWSLMLSSSRAATALTSPRLRATSATSVAAAFLSLLVLHSSLVSRTRPQLHATALYSLSPSTPQALTILLITAPRPGNPPFLLQTLDSYLSSLPSPSSPSSARVNIVVYTHFANHSIFDAAKAALKADKRAEKYVTWVRQVRQGKGGNVVDQRLHLARALAYVTGQEVVSRNLVVEAAAGRSATPQRAGYVMLAEDDFPLCPDPAPWGPFGQRRGSLSGGSYERTWGEVARLVVGGEALMPIAPLATTPTNDPDDGGQCGVFVGTGGSGLIIRSPLAAKLPSLLLGPEDPLGKLRERSGPPAPPADGAAGEVPSDVLIQDCLMGRHAGCEQCAPRVRSAGGPRTSRAWQLANGRRKSGLVSSRRLLMRHLGYNASTVPDRKYKREEWECGWRHPFNGDPDAWTL